MYIHRIKRHLGQSVSAPDPFQASRGEGGEEKSSEGAISQQRRRPLCLPLCNVIPVRRYPLKYVGVEATVSVTAAAACFQRFPPSVKKLNTIIIITIINTRGDTIFHSTKPSDSRTGCSLPACLHFPPPELIRKRHKQPVGAAANIFLDIL